MTPYDDGHGLLRPDAAPDVGIDDSRLPGRAIAVLGTGMDFAAARAELERALAAGESWRRILFRFERLQRIAAARALVTDVDVEDLHRIHETHGMACGRGRAADDRGGRDAE